MKTSLILTLAIMLFQVAAYSQDIDLTEGKIEAVEAGNRQQISRESEGNIDLTEGKIEAAEVDMRKDLLKDVEAKEIKAIQLINLVAKYNNDRFTSDVEKGESEDAYYAFLARYNTLRESRAIIEKKEISASLHDLRNYSERFELLIKDIQKFLK